MTTLTGKKPSLTYKDLLQISNSNSGIDTTVRNIEDGEGTVGPFAISTTTFRVPSSKSFDMASGSLLKVAGTNLTKGGIITGTGAGAVVVQAAGSNGQAVVADSATANGIKYAYKGWHKISEVSAASSSAVAFTSGIDSTFDHYMIVFHNVTCGSGGADFYLRVSVSSGSWATGVTDYEYNVVRRTAAVAGFGNIGNSQGAAQILLSGEIDQDNTGGVDGRILFSDPSTSRIAHFFDSQLRGNDGSGTPIPIKEDSIGAYNGSTAALVGVQFLMSTGVLVTGTFALYGLGK